MTHICVSNLAIIGSDNGLSPGRRQAIILTNAGILSIGPLGTNFSEILIKIQTFSFMKMDLNVSSAKWRPFCVGLNVLMEWFVAYLSPYICLNQCKIIVNWILKFNVSFFSKLTYLHLSKFIWNCHLQKYQPFMWKIKPFTMKVYLNSLFQSMEYSLKFLCCTFIMELFQNIFLNTVTNALYPFYLTQFHTAQFSLRTDVNFLSLFYGLLTR